MHFHNKAMLPKELKKWKASGNYWKLLLSCSAIVEELPDFFFHFSRFSTAEMWPSPFFTSTRDQQTMERPWHVERKIPNCLMQLLRTTGNSSFIVSILGAKIQIFLKICTKQLRIRYTLFSSRKLCYFYIGTLAPCIDFQNTKQLLHLKVLQKNVIDCWFCFFVMPINDSFLVLQMHRQWPFPSDRI